MANPLIQTGAALKGECRRANQYIAGGVVYPGDLVTTNSSGFVVASAATTALLGVALSYASASGQNLVVADHPDQEIVMEASAAQIAAQTNLNLNYDIVATSGSTTYKLSRMQLDSSTGATTATLPLKALALEPNGNNVFGANCRVVCVINNHQLKGGTGTIGT